MSQNLPSQVEVLIIGGGIAGCSVAYHLAQLGIRDIALLERKSLTSGTTWHAAGLLAQLRDNETQTRLCQYSMDLYEGLEAETGVATGIKRNGTLMLARTPERLTELQYRHSDAGYYGLETYLVSPTEAGGMWPLIRTDDLAGGLYVPSDGQVDPTGVTMALAKGARNMGVRKFENTNVTQIQSINGQVTSVQTDQGMITCEKVVLCGGMWTQFLARDAGANVPLQAFEHMYLITEPMEGLTADLPSIRDYDGLIYFKEDAGKLIMGGTERNARPWAVNGIPENFEFDRLNEDWEQFNELIDSAMNRLPALENTGIRQLLNGPESFTPDGKYIIGEMPEIRNLFVCAGFNSVGIVSSGGAGKAIAEWIAAGEATMDLMDVDVQRFTALQGRPKYLQERVKETVSWTFSMHWPNLQPEKPRGVRRSPLHDQLAKRNACFADAAGWERPNWFAPDGMEPVYQYSFGRQNWFDAAAAEHQAVRERVGLIDITSFSKLLLRGAEALNLLQYLCTKDLDIAIGRIVYTLMTNARGGIECDVTITRTGTDEFLIYCGAGVVTRVRNRITRNIQPSQSVLLDDVTSGTGVIAIMGPESRKLLSRLTSADLSNEAFPFLTSQTIDLSYAPCRASRVTFSGELGWELNIPTEYCAGIYEDLIAAGADLGGSDVGFHALDSLRIERGYRHWGHDIGPKDTVLEAGLGFAVDAQKPMDFIGRDAIAAQKQSGVKSRLVIFVLDDPEPVLLHGEPIRRNGKMVGYVTSAAYGHTVGAAIAMGYVSDKGIVDADFVHSGSYEIEIIGKYWSATASLSAPVDPKGIRMRK